MSGPHEIELKLELDPQEAPGRGGRRRGAGLPAGGDTRRLVSRYFDTQERSLQKQGFVLRVRQDGERRIQTLKGEGDGGLERSEWEGDVPGDAPDLASLRDRGHAVVLEDLGDLRPAFDTVVERTTWRIDRGGSEIELALDEGEIVAESGREPIREIELELKSGTVADLFGLAREIASARPVRLGVRSKSERGYDLAGAAAASRLFVKAERVTLRPGGDAGAAFQAVARACLRHFRLNEPALVGQRSTEALHQARVALRRLRSALTLFRDVIAGPEVLRLKRELRALSEPLGRARDLDVYLGRVREAEAATARPEPALRELAARLMAERERAYDQLVRRLNARRWRIATLDLLAFVEAGPWRTDEARAKHRDRPARKFAARVLERRWRKVKRTGRDLAALEPEARHAVRIEAKKLRYASEFFASLVEGGKGRRRHKAFVAALEGLQGALGDLNDMATQAEMARELAAASGDGAGPSATALPPGLAEDGREATLLASAAEAHRALRHAEPFWR